MKSDTRVMVESIGLFILGVFIVVCSVVIPIAIKDSRPVINTPANVYSPPITIINVYIYGATNKTYNTLSTNEIKELDSKLPWAAFTNYTPIHMPWITSTNYAPITMEYRYTNGLLYQWFTNNIITNGTAGGTLNLFLNEAQRFPAIVEPISVWSIGDSH